MKKLNLLIFTSLALASIILSASVTHAQEISVVEVKRNITLADDDVVYRDYYINAGDGSALRKNLVVKVKRKIYVKESATKTVGDFETQVGLLKVIQVGNKVSVAREFKLTSRDEEAMLEQTGIMAGDKIDLNGSYIDYSKPNYKKTSENEVKKPEPVQTAGLDSANVIESSSTAPVNTAPTTTTEAPSTTETQKADDKRIPANELPPLLKKIIPLPATI
jgi:hypothetical protein